MELGVIGTGLMGAPMARRLLDGGHRLTVFNRTPDKTAPLAAAGARVAGSPAEVLASATATVLMVTDAAAVRAVVVGDEPRRALAGRTILQASTIAPSESLEIADEVVAAGGRYLEAPVLGSITQAREGTLIVMAGGPRDLFETWRPVLALLGPEPRLIGPVGAAAALKLALNQLIASLTASFALSLGYVRAQDLEVETFMEILRASALYAPTFDKKLDRMLANDYARANFPTRLMLKDVRLFLGEGRRAGLDTAALAGVEQILVAALAMGHGDSDYSALAAPIMGQQPPRG